MSHGIGRAQRRLLARLAAVQDVLQIDVDIELLLVLPGTSDRANLYRALSSLEGRGLVVLQDTRQRTEGCRRCHHARDDHRDGRDGCEHASKWAGPLACRCRRYAAPPRARPCWQIRLTPAGRALVRADEFASMCERCRELQRYAADFDAFLADVANRLNHPG